MCNVCQCKTMEIFKKMNVAGKKFKVTIPCGSNGYEEKIIYVSVHTILYGTMYSDCKEISDDELKGLIPQFLTIQEIEIKVIDNIL